MDDLQFYPTPKRLAKHVWSKFKTRDFARVLDPSAGDGALCDAAPRDYYSRGPKIDCIEVDATKHPILREKTYRIVGLDFLSFEGGHCYSHVVMNPPFVHGAEHVLKAWDMLYEGEIVAIINAQTPRNPHTAPRQRLASLVAEHGDVEFISDAFKGADVAREADVEIALVHLVKPAECAQDWIGPVIEAMAIDHNEEQVYELPRELALPASFVETQVRAFRYAVKAMREAVRAQAVANHYAARIGRTMADLTNNRNGDQEAQPDTIRKDLEEGYDKLKDRAWASVLRSTETLSKLSSKVQQQAESQFEDIKTLEFTESNVYGFLLGLVQSQPEMQLDMMCEVFDLITRYWSDNTVFYRGWKSNDKHRSMGMRIKMTRIVLPHMRSFLSSLDWSALRILADIDKAFALLDGKTQPEVSLVSLFETQFRSLQLADRLQSSYFDVRYYKGVGTCHLYPRNKQLVDRLNRTVGRRRDWLPPPDQPGNDAYWKQYDHAEKLNAEFQAEVNRKHAGPRAYQCDHPIARFMRTNEDATVRAEAEVTLARAIDTVLERHGLLEALTHAPTGFQPLLLAA